MPTTLLDGIGLLVTGSPEHGDGSALGEVAGAALVVDDDGMVAWVGPSGRAPAADTQVDAAGRCVVPGFVDSHSHLVFAGDRAAEFEARMAGRRYEAGGIRSTVAATRAASDEDLAANLVRLLEEMRRQGTTTVEIKSGYGLTVHDEARSLALAHQYTDETTFLGAHVVPAEFAHDPDGYVDIVTGAMLDACAPHARWVDVFCEHGAFDAAAARAVLTAGWRRACRRESTPTSSGRALAFSWPVRSVRPASTTAPTCPQPTSTPCRPPAPSHAASRCGVLDLVRRTPTHAA